jgi:hypothetical protein
MMTMLAVGYRERKRRRGLHPSHDEDDDDLVWPLDLGGFPLARHCCLMAATEEASKRRSKRYLFD